MDTKTVFFYLFSAVMLFAAFRVITARNPVYAALYLVLTFTQASALWLLLKAEFLAITLVLVYVGAVMVLFLFVVMMLEVNLEALRKGFWKHFPLAAFLGVLIALQIAWVVMGGFRNADGVVAGQSVLQNAAQVSNTKELGKLLYSQYIYPLEVAAFILLVAMIAAIALTLRSRKDSKYISAGDQVRVKAGDRMTVLKMDATRAVDPKMVDASMVEEKKA